MGIQAFLKGIKASYIEIQSTVIAKSARFLTVSDDLMGLDGSSIPGSVLAKVITVRFWAGHFVQTMPLSTPVFMGYWRIYSSQKRNIHLPLTTNPRVGAILP